MAYGLPQQRIGTRDNKIMFLKRTLTYNDLSEPVETWAPYGEAWAAVQYVSVAEALVAGAERASKIVKFRVNWRTDITEADRVLLDRVTYQIKGLTQMGRFEMLEILAMRMEGQAE